MTAFDMIWWQLAYLGWACKQEQVSVTAGCVRLFPYMTSHLLSGVARSGQSRAGSLDLLHNATDCVQRAIHIK